MPPNEDEDTAVLAAFAAVARDGYTLPRDVTVMLPSERVMTGAQITAAGAEFPPEAGGFPFPLAEPAPEPVMITRPCGCTSMVIENGELPVQVSWCDEHDPGHESP